MVVIPAISMRLWSEERKAGTLELLLTLPVSLAASVLGKFLAAAARPRATRRSRLGDFRLGQHLDVGWMMHLDHRTAATLDPSAHANAPPAHR